MSANMYIYLWKKYRPAILKLMVDSANGPQEYQFSKHEFHDVNPKEKGGYSFTLRVFQSKALKELKTSVLAMDLLAVLQSSRKASELTETATYEFMLDKQFLLHITHTEVEKEEEEPELEADAEEVKEADSEAEENVKADPEAETKKEKKAK